MLIKLIAALVFLSQTACAQNQKNNTNYKQLETGAEQISSFLPLLKGKSVGVFANQTAVIGKTHLVDSLVRLGVNIRVIFGPEHGFRGKADAGEHVDNNIDAKTGIQVISLYGNHKKPTSEDLKNIDILIFDVQDVGVRFYTYLTTLHYVMEACAENNKQLIVFDRPNPNGYYVDGPILEEKFKSMVGMHPIPLVHGMTLGELAKMINGEHWLPNNLTCKLEVIPIQNYFHNLFYPLPVAPSPNLPNSTSIILYPSLGLFEGTQISMGRGTEKPFECFGAPWLKMGNYQFTPVNIAGKAVNPPYINQNCRGFLLTDFANDYIVTYKHIYLDWLVLLYKDCPDKNKFFNSFFDKLTGTDLIRMQIIEGKSAVEIRKTWEPGLKKFLEKRAPYMIYTYDEDLGLMGKKEKK